MKPFGNLSLRGRVTLTGTAVVAILVLALDVFVYVSLRDQLFSNLENVLDAREQLVMGLREELDPVELSERLDEAGIRAVVTMRDGRMLRSAGAPGFGTLPPAQPDEPLSTRTIPLQDGATAIVLASRGGIESTLERLLLFAGIGSIAVVALAYGMLAWGASRVLRPVREVAATARHIADGNHEERLTAREDDTELKEMVEAFNDMLDALETAIARSQEAEQVSRRFLADAAHQLRTPAAGIRASIGSVLRTGAGEQRERLLDNLAAESARMSRLLSSLLRVARLDSREEPSLAATEVTSVVERVIDQQRVRAPRLAFQVVGEQDVVARVDVDSFEEAIGNLLDNAARHARGRVAVEVVQEAAGSGADVTVVRVRDDGPGVPADARERIFDRFVSLDGGAGSGLGLPIARGIAQAHGGTLGYEDGAFVLRVPTAGAPWLGGGATDASPAATGRASGRTDAPARSEDASAS